MEYSLLALLSGGLLGVWQFGLGLYRGRISRYTVLLVSATAAGISYLLFALLTQSLIFDPLDVGAGLLGGFFNVLGTLMLLRAFECGKIGVASGVAATSTLVLIAYSVFLGEPMSARTIAGLIAILVGLAMFYGAHLRDESPPQQGKGSGRAILWALGTALFWGLANIVLDIGSRVSINATLTVSEIPQVILALSLVLLVRPRLREGVTRPSVAILVGAGIALALSNSLFFFAANMSDIGVVGVLASLSPIVTALLALAVFKERMVRLEWAALIVVILGTCIVLS